MDMLERVARALCEQAIRERRRWDSAPSDLEEMLPAAIEHAWRDFTGEARAAIAAMLEPSDSMETAGNDAISYHPDDILCNQAGSCWSAMINAALHSPPSQP